METRQPNPEEPIKPSLAGEQSTNPPAVGNMSSPAKPSTKTLGLVIIIVIVAVAIGIAGLVLNKRQLTSSTTTKIVEAATVQITKDGFIPGTIQIKVGQVITWKNTDSQPHRIAADPHPNHTSLPELDSQEPLAKDETYGFTFDKAGTYTYHDHLNPLKLKGTVVVE